MLGNGDFIITIGNYGTIVTLYSAGNDKLKNKIFIEEFNDAAKEELKKLFNQNKKSDVYFLLDTVDQVYRKKSYPAIRKIDIKQIIKRDLQNDIDKDSIKNYIITNDYKSIKTDGRWECLFISSSISENIAAWLDFVYEMPNRIAGIHMLPIESFSLFKLLKNDIDKRSRGVRKRRSLYCIVVQNKVSGIRQIVFSEKVIVFTRIVNYDFKDIKFLEKYEHDIYSTYEYLKRLFPEISINDLEVVNILSEKVLEKIQTISNVELNFINYSPNQAALTAGFKDVAEDSSYCDLIISKVFAKTKKKILKFFTAKIEKIEQFYYGVKFVNYFNILLFIAICIGATNITFVKNEISQALVKAKSERTIAIAKLSKIIATNLEETESIEDLDGSKIDRITDIGKAHEYFRIFKPEFFNIYNKLSFVKDHNTTLSVFNYSLENFNKDAESRNIIYKTTIRGKILNENGDLEKLFVGFDGLISAVKRNFEGDEVIYSELPRNVDFTKKYYEENIDVTINRRIKIDNSEQ